MAILYVLAYDGYELLIVSIFVDAVFGSILGETHQLYTLTVGCILIIANISKPLLKFYT
jgi:hypothetical protein